MKLLITPDYGLSDIWHFNYPLKNLLSESLRQGKLPLWTDLIGNGYPIAAEGQIGAFSPLNWAVFGLLPMPLAFMTALFLSLVIAFWGSYYLLRSYGKSKLNSTAGGIFVAINGYFLVHFTHLNLLQSYAFIPWAFFFVEKIISEKSYKTILYLAITLSQMILVGYPQTFINCLLILEIYILAGSRKKIAIFWKNSYKILIAAVLALGLSAIQLFPLFELVRQSNTIEAAAGQRFIHPLPVKNLLTMFYPFLFGNPSLGTYPYGGRGWPIFWENTIYIGILPLILIIVAIILRFKQHLSDKSSLIKLLAVFFTSVILALGKTTPAGYLFKLPPLSFTRIEPRFLAFANISLALLAGLAWSEVFFKWKIKNYWKIGLITGHISQIFFVFRNYHVWDDSTKWLQTPEIINQLDTNSRIISRNQESLWRQTDPTAGWFNKENIIWYNRNSLGPNSNMIFDIKQLGVYAQQYPARYDQFRYWIYGEDVLGKNIRTIFGVNYILDGKSGKVTIEQNQNVLPDIYSVKQENIYQVKDYQEAFGRMNQSTFDPLNEVLWENSLLPDQNEEVIVVNRSFYPGWKAFLSQKQIEIYPVNINQQAVIVPKNTDLSLLKFKYDPLSYKIGGGISIASLLVWVFLFRKFRYNIG